MTHKSRSVKEDRALEVQVDQAEANLASAQEILDESKKLATDQELADQVETIEDDLDITDKTIRSGPVIREGLCGMLAGLETLQAKTEETTGEATKKQRLEDGRSKPSSVASALQPFGGAGR